MTDILARLKQDIPAYVGDNGGWEIDEERTLALLADAAAEIERLRLFEIYANGDIEAQVEGAIEAKKLTGKYPFED